MFEQQQKIVINYIQLGVQTLCRNLLLLSARSDLLYLYSPVETTRLLSPLYISGGNNEDLVYTIIKYLLDSFNTKTPS